ncbi:MAG: VWA domain-containing protein, partial [Chloroflexi bacterium]|nr:VWA domain-containing protein [Chloroflexota bacterium]
MQFLWPSWLSLLLLVPVLAVIYLRAQRRRQQQAQRYAHLSLFQDLRRKDPGARRHIPALLFLLGVVIMIIAVARPFTVVTIPSLDRTVILAIDVSGSMRAEDMKPNRIEAAKSAARAFVERQEPSTRVGVVSFS